MTQPRPATTAMIDIPACAWQRPIGLGWDKPYTVRYASNLDDGPWHGAPLGGLGAGCLGRSSRGDFNFWHIDGGEHVFKSLPACQFSVFEQVEGQPSQAYALCTEAPEDGSLSSWQWYPTNGGTYHALYPRSWFAYEGIFQTELVCEQFSPVWANNYQEASYPVAIFQWTLRNPTNKTVTLSILLTWQNTVGWFTNAQKSPKVTVRDDGSPVYVYEPKWRESTGNFNQSVFDHYRAGIILDRQGQEELEPEEGDGQWAIATTDSFRQQIFYHTRWNPEGDGSEVWQPFAQDGSLNDLDDDTPAQAGEQTAAALAVRITLLPGETRTVPFILAWDFPVTEFAQGVTEYRRYTDFFGRSGGNAWSMVRDALKRFSTWREQIVNWQAPILNDPELPDWYKMALFNELYQLTAGGTLWSAASEDEPRGQFATLECLDYRWYESLDVRLYGSFALLLLWPELEKSVLRAFARAVPQHDETPRIIGYNQASAIRKAKNAVPHDLGAPNEHPWVATNYTSYQDCNLWKDLACDFVLQVYRDYLFTQSRDLEFLQFCWPSIVGALEHLKTEFDLDGDGIPENSGAPDQTFDDWRLQGVSAYCGGLWLAALEAAIVMADILEEDASQLKLWLEQARPIYNALWNGQYYRLDMGSGSDVVMADQLCGQFYARLLNLPDLVPEANIQTALDTIYNSCFLKFQAGKFGAANGVRPDGSPENPDATHPLEVWTGINFGLAAFLKQMGHADRAMTLTETVVRQIYDNGLQFRTPEAITAAGTFRACLYLRATAIWALQAVKL
ncbi:GH116 family glycosyl hydrolase [Leptolyngbya sp. FACHB-261]|uniref:GH116 family glycosyl hydrolase n=1 Tax=Leptolyngbya sp. FACHB-261 TaxID=2692806 RepID=UPI0016880ABE|nr:GH116 family glycosyl hydrolase [Leptolyngbya sp. FACHB-261]MBD2101986.1 bile acid beta-glucosidase [Leptolyngbya sp. FACHB-261]